MSLFTRGLLLAVLAMPMLMSAGIGHSHADTYRVYGVTSNDVLHIRETASTKSNIVVSIPPYGKGIEMLGPCDGSRCKVSYQGIIGWTSMNYLTLEGSRDSTYSVKGVAHNDVLNIRTSPSVKSNIVGEIPPDGSGISKLGPCEGNWCQISYRGVIGWSSMMYLVADTIVPPSLTSQPPDTQITGLEEEPDATNPIPFDAAEDPAAPIEEGGINTIEQSKSVRLELTYPAGKSPSVFTEGWVFGARCTKQNLDGLQADCSNDVVWSGTGTFVPSQGSTSRPTFMKPGPNRIVVSVSIDGEQFEKGFDVNAVNPSYPTRYAKVGDAVYAAVGYGGTTAGIYPLNGVIRTGSPTVTIGGLPAARANDKAQVHPSVADGQCRINNGDPNVRIDGYPAAREGDTLDCGLDGEAVIGTPATKHRYEDIAAGPQCPESNPHKNLEFPSSNLKQIIDTNSNPKDGTYMVCNYFSDGSLELEIPYKNGDKTGFGFQFDFNAACGGRYLYHEMAYSDDEYLFKRQYVCNPNTGNVDPYRFETYSDGDLVGKTEFYAGGNKSRHWEYDPSAGTTITIDFNEEGDVTECKRQDANFRTYDCK